MVLAKLLKEQIQEKTKSGESTDKTKYFRLRLLDKVCCELERELHIDWNAKPLGFHAGHRNGECPWTHTRDNISPAPFLFYPPRLWNEERPSWQMWSRAKICCSPPQSPLCSQVTWFSWIKGYVNCVHTKDCQGSINYHTQNEELLVCFLWNCFLCVADTLFPLSIITKLIADLILSIKL